MIIYIIQNTKNYKNYVGQTTTSLNDRWTSHLSSSRRNKPDIVVDLAIAKYGAESFKIFEICKANSQQELDELEKFYISFLGTLTPEFGYNIREGGKGGKHSQEAKLKMSFSQRRRSPETCRKHAESLRGRTRGPSPLRGRKFPFKGKGRKWSQELKDKVTGSRVWITNGVQEIPVKANSLLKDGWRRGRSEGFSQTLQKEIRVCLRICFLCFKPFDAKNHLTGVFCSISCSNRFWNRKRKEIRNTP